VNRLADWLKDKLQERGMTLHAASVRSGVAIATLSDILHQGHVPRVETLFRLADMFDTGRVDILMIAGHLRRGDELPGAPQPGRDHHDEDNLEWQLVHEFRKLPVEWQPDAVEQVRWIARLVKRRRYRLIGSEEEEREERR
jgi:transcriptional regulator with XRE-family HTH domain